MFKGMLTHEIALVTGAEFGSLTRAVKIGKGIFE
jgi:hypothetical protein